MRSELATNPPDESALVRAVLAGDTGAFEPLLEQHLDQVRGFIALRLPVPHLVNEIAHDTFVFAFRQLDRFEPGTNFRAWLRAIAANLIRAELQRFQRQQSNQLGFARHQLLLADSAMDAAAQADELEYLEECLRELPPALQELVDWKHREELPVAEIARRQGRTENAVWQALFRMRQQLRLCIEGKLARGRA